MSVEVGIEKKKQPADDEKAHPQANSTLKVSQKRLLSVRVGVRLV